MRLSFDGIVGCTTGERSRYFKKLAKTPILREFAAFEKKPHVRYSYPTVRLSSCADQELGAFTYNLFEEVLWQLS